MKKTIISIAAVAFVALMIANAYATTIPVPPWCSHTCYPPGFTPGFWKHDIEVRLSHPAYNMGLTKAAYNAFGWSNVNGELDGIKLSDGMMDDLLAVINKELTNEGLPTIDFVTALNNLKLNGWDPLRTNTANWFNWAAGYGPF